MEPVVAERPLATAPDPARDEVRNRGVRRPARWIGIGLVVVLLGLFFVWPVVDIVLRSFDPQGRVSYTHPRISWTHYAEVFREPALRAVLRNTLVLAVWSTFFTVLLAYPAAYLLSRLRRRLALPLLVLILVPFWVSILVRLFAFTQVLGTKGLVNKTAGLFGLGPFRLLFNTQATVIGMVNYLLPYMILILYASMAGVDPNLTVAAKSLGATAWQAFRRVFFPVTKGALVAGTLLVFVLALGFFLTPAVLGGAKNTTIAVFIQQRINLFDWGAASAMGIVLLVVTIIGFTIAVRVSGVAGLMGRTRGSQKGVSQVDPLERSPMTLLLWIDFVIVLAILLVPLIIVIPVSFDKTEFITFPPQGLSLHWYHEVLTNPLWTSAIWKSFKTGVGVAFLATGLALLLARAMLTLRSQLTKSALQAFVYAPLVVPVILLAIGILDVQTKTHLLGTTWGLIFAHTVLALPFTFAITYNALAGLDPAIEEAAWTMGATRTRTFFVVVLRQILPSIVGAMLLAFITSWDEVVIALFQTVRQQTLPVTIFSFLKAGVQPSVAAVATLLIAIVLIAMVVGQLVGGRMRRRRTVKA